MKNWKGFIKYYLVFLFVTVMMSGISHFIIYRTVYDKTIGEKHQELTNGAENINSKLESLFQAVNEIYYYQDAIWLMNQDQIHPEDYLRLRTFRQMLKMTSFQEEWIADYYLYFPKSGVVFDKSRVYFSLEEVYESFSNIEGFSLEMFKQAFLNTEFSFHPAEILNVEGKQITVLPYVQRAVGTSDIVMVAMLNAEVLVQEAAIADDSAAFAIYNGDQVLYDQGLLSMLENEVYTDWQHAGNGHLRKDNYVLLESETRDYNIRFQTLLSGDNLNALLNDVLRGYVIILATVAFFGLVILIVAERLFNKQYRNMAKHYKEQKDVIQAYHINRLLETFAEDKEIEEAGQFLEIDEEKMAMAGILRCEKGISIQKGLDKILYQSAGETDTEKERVAVVQRHGHEAALVFYNITYAPIVIQKYLNRMAALGEDSSSEYFMVFGNSYETMRGIAVSYMEARKTLEYCRTYPDAQIQCYSQLPTVSNVTTLGLESRNKLQVLIISNEKEKAIQFFKDIYRQQRKDEIILNPVLANNFIAQIASVLIYCIEQMIKDKTDRESRLAEVSRLFSLPDYVEFESYVNNLIEVLCRKKDQSQEEQIQKILDYIHKNYNDPDLSLIQMGETFHMNPGYFSQYFKQQTGKNFSQYLESIRIGRALELLESSNKSVGSIMSEAGYVNRNTFYKAFIRVHGISPKAYKDTIIKKEG